MNFKTIELNGFKSFADKIDIKFDKGITAIVGPNGCGKSNVADAIRWVLGEQSAKSLRGGTMQDVIFNGTQLRRSQSYCEVSLFFDNSEKMFDIEYNEVIFTRKLYRSGESEYMINRQPCRLKDIVGHLHTVGIGKEGYSIIGQNKIAEIMNAKPDERRSIFEEATGIAVFKAKKAEIERKLLNSGENLARYKDIFGEVERQLAPLAKQAESARTYMRLAEDLKSHEVNTYLYKFDNAESVKEKISLKLQSITEDLDDKRDEQLKIQKEYESGQIRRSQMDTLLYQLQEKLREREVSSEKQQGESKVYYEKRSALKSEALRLSQEIALNEAKIDAIDEQNETLTKEIADLERQSEVKTKELARISEELSEVTEKVAIYERAAELSREQVMSSMEDLAQMKESVGSLSAEKQAAIERQDEIAERIVALETKRSKLLEERQELNVRSGEIDARSGEIKEEIAALETQMNAVELKIAETDVKINAENTRAVTLEANERMLSAMKDAYDGYNGSVKRLMTAAKDNNSLNDKIKGVIADIIKTEQNYETAIETAVGGAMQNIVTATPDDARYLIEYLKQTKGGMVTFLPVSSVKPRMENPTVLQALREKGAVGSAHTLVKYDRYYDNIVKFLLGNTVVCDNIANAVEISKKYRNAFKIVTLEGDVINPSGSMTGGYRKGEAASFLANERRLAQVAADLKDSTEKLDGLRLHKSGLEKNKQQISAKIAALTSENSANAQELVAIKSKTDMGFKTESEILTEYEGYKKSGEIIAERLNKILNDFTATYEGSEKVNKLKSDAKSEMEKNKSEYDSLKSRQGELSTEYSQMNMDLNTMGMTVKSNRAEIERIKTEREQSLIRIEEAGKEIEEKERLAEEFKNAALAVALSPEEMSEINSEKERIKNLNDEKSELTEQLNALDNKKTMLTEEIERLTEKKHGEELALSKVDIELENMRERIWEEYQATYEDSQSLRIEDYNVVEGKTHINRIKKEMSALGNINYNAIEDYTALEERHKDMIVQKEDLEKAHADLITILGELRNEMQNQFDEGFEKINENFKRTFKELFGGGRAELQMDYSDCEDPLQAGVEIVAEPPGKKLQKISLLSGGEQALTAIAILFAILKLRAMPFCVLDEIEAALDEANVDRFARYLKNFSKETQFIVITHRKPTMELADALYGVTMEEKGVSRMVSVKLSDIGTKLNIA